MISNILFDGSFWTAVTSFLGAAAAAAGIWAFFLTSREARDKDAELTRFQQSAKLDISEANARAAEASLKTAQIYEKLRWRHLTKETQERLTSSLKAIDCGPILVLTAPGDPETAQYSHEIAAAIAAAGKLHESTHHPSAAGSFTGRMMPVGIYLLRNARDSDATSKTVDSLVALLRDAGLPVNEFTVDGMTPDILRLQIGYNPTIANELKSP